MTRAVMVEHRSGWAARDNRGTTFIMSPSGSATTIRPGSWFGASSPSPAEWPGERPAYASLAVAVQSEASRWNVPGIAVGLLHHAHEETTATGITSIATRQAVRDDTIFQIGSISKVFTATLAMRLAEQGLLDLDAPVISYLPDLPLADASARESITLRHLFSHGAGFEGDRFIDYGRGDDALAKSIAEFDTLQQWTKPGELFLYCNAGFYLAGRVIEVVLDTPFETVMRERLFEPLGLRTAVFFAEEAITLPHAVGHRLKSRDAGHTIAEGYSLPRNVNAAGGIVTSTSELLRFARMHIDDGEIDGTRLISAHSATAMREPRMDAGQGRGWYGIGWAINDYDDFRIVGHGGATGGFRAQLTVVPERSFAIAILTNGETGSRAIQEIEAWALDHYLGFRRPVPDAIALPKKALDALAGTYVRHDGRFTVSRAGDRLEIDYVGFHEETGELEDEATLSFEPLAEQRFRSVAGPSTGNILEFIDLPTEGGATRHLLRSGGRLAERLTEPAKASSSKGKGKGAKRDRKATAGA